MLWCIGMIGLVCEEGIPIQGTFMWMRSGESYGYYTLALQRVEMERTLQTFCLDVNCDTPLLHPPSHTHTHTHTQLVLM
jgi:hypothetical protein